MARCLVEPLERRAIPGLRIPHLFLPIWMNPLVIDWRLSLLGFWPARVFYACGAKGSIFSGKYAFPLVARMAKIVRNWHSKLGRCVSQSNQVLH